MPNTPAPGTVVAEVCPEASVSQVETARGAGYRRPVLPFSRGETRIERCRGLLGDECLTNNLTGVLPTKYTPSRADLAPRQTAALRLVARRGCTISEKARLFMFQLQPQELLPLYFVKSPQIRKRGNITHEIEAKINPIWMCNYIITKSMASSQRRT